MAEPTQEIVFHAVGGTTFPAKVNGNYSVKEWKS